MAKVRAHQANQPANGAAEGGDLRLLPLQVSGIVVRKSALIEALRVYVPALTDLQVTDDGEHFWLMLGPGDAASPRLPASD